MADTKISAESSATAITYDDVFEMVDDPSGTPANKKVSGLVMGVASGTAFPGSPATNNQFYRSDRGIRYVYDGTRWISANLYSEMALSRSALPLSATGTLDILAPWAGFYDIYLIGAYIGFFVTGGSALSGSHKWVFTFVSDPATTTHATLNVDSGANDVWRSTATTIGALLGTSNPHISVNVTKTGTPGNIYALARLEYKLVG